MNKFIFSSVLTIFILGCTHSGPYKVANKAGYGYQETQLGDTQYRVGFKHRGIELSSANNYALLRAAELTLENGYDWFEVVDHQSEIFQDKHATTSGKSATSGRRTQLDCGLLVCLNKDGIPKKNMRIGINYGNRQGDTEVLLEIRIDKGTLPKMERAYSAEEIIAHLQPQLSKQSLKK